MTYPTVTEITSARREPIFLPADRAASDYATHATQHGYRERAAQLRALDTAQCDEHGSSAIYCGCRS